MYAATTYPAHPSQKLRLSSGLLSISTSLCIYYKQGFALGTQKNSEYVYTPANSNAVADETVSLSSRQGNMELTEHR